MPYATVQDMITRFGADELIQLTNRAGVVVSDEMLGTLAGGGDLSGFTPEEQAATQAVLEAVLEALGDAAAEIDPKLQARYALPLASVPRVLVKCACDIARYNLFGDHATEVVTKRYDDAIRFLRAVARGDESLGLDQAQEETPATGGAQFAAPGRVFTSDLLKGYTG